MQQYVLNIDWLAIYGYHAMPLDDAKAAPEVYRSQSETEPDRPAGKDDKIDTVQAALTMAALQKKHIGSITLELLQYGTRQFSMLANVYISREKIGVLQAYPRTSTLPRNAMIFKVENQWLYRPDWRAQIGLVFRTLHIVPKSISRIDLAADFNRFACGLHPIEFIRGFMTGEIKHKGRGAGHCDFVQRYAYLKGENRLVDTLHFNALTIGKKTSDAHCYLYNKTLELEQIKMKPWIVECWSQAGFNIDDVWRLEVTCQDKALKFKDKSSGALVELTFDDIAGENHDEVLATYYHMMIHSLFFFFYPTGQKNVSREQMIDLFGDRVPVDRGVVRMLNPSTRTERILIKQLYTMMHRYRGMDLNDGLQSQSLAYKLVDTMNLNGWMARKMDSWKSDKFKV